MITVNNKSYSFEFIAENCFSFTKKNDLTEFEKELWYFFNFWYDESKSSFEIKTSGSTGLPKTIVLQKKHIQASAKATCEYFNFKKDQKALLCLPLSSVGGMMMLARALVVEMNLLILKPSSNPLKNINENIDFVAMVPFQVQSIFNENPEKWKFIRSLIIGGGTVSLSLKNRIIKSQLNAYSTFGMTETISHIALNKIRENNIYTALGDCSFSINSENCLLINAKHLGINNLQTNDLVDLLNSKQFIWQGRKDNAIETGGIKIIPELVEGKIAHLIKQRFFISSLPDQLLNNKLILVIEGKLTISKVELIPFLKKYECPKEIYFVNAFVDLKNGKISRKETMKELRC